MVGNIIQFVTVYPEIVTNFHDIKFTIIINDQRERGETGERYEEMWGEEVDVVRNFHGWILRSEPIDFINVDSLYH